MSDPLKTDTNYTQTYTGPSEQSIGAQRAAPATVAQIQAQTKQAERMALCPACGNKRCPKATNHGYACTGSNEPGQVGILEQPAPPQPAVESEELPSLLDARGTIPSDGIPSEIYIATGRGRYEDDDTGEVDQYEIAKATAASVRFDTQSRIRELESQLKTDDYDAINLRCFSEGEDAHDQGKSLAENPHPPGTLPHEAWEEGWKVRDYDRITAQLAALQSTPAWIDGDRFANVEDGVWVEALSSGRMVAHVVPTGSPLLTLSGRRYCRIGPVPTREGEVG